MYCSGCVVEALSLRENGLGNVGAELLAVALSHLNCRLRSLDISSNRITQDTSGQRVTNAEGLSRLCSAIASRGHLTYIDLASNGIGERTAPGCGAAMQVCVFSL